MSNHPNRSGKAKIARDYIARRESVERVRIDNGEVHAFGTLPNTNHRGWYFAGYVDDLVAEARVEPRA